MCRSSWCLSNSCFIVGSSNRRPRHRGWTSVTRVNFQAVRGREFTASERGILFDHFLVVLHRSCIVEHLHACLQFPLVWQIWCPRESLIFAHRYAPPETPAPLAGCKPTAELSTKASQGTPVSHTLEAPNPGENGNPRPRHPHPQLHLAQGPGDVGLVERVGPF